MDILDIILAKSMTPQGQIDTYAAKAQKAVTDAKKVVNDIETITEQTNTNNENAQTALENAQAAAQEYESIVADIDERIAGAGKTEAELTSTTTSSYNAKNIILTYSDNTTTSLNAIEKNYKTTGNNEDGSMTQKAITQALNNATINLGAQNNGKITKVNSDGSITSSSISESDLQTLIDGGSVAPIVTNAILGVIIDYENKTVTRCENAINLTPGTDFNQFSMYGGRMRCNVNSSGRITAWYGDNNYADDGSNGDVMVYQPKFYYKRTINKSVNNTVGKIVRKETLLISETEQTGFKLHPRFKSTSGETLEYVLLPAYEGSTYDVSISSFNRNDSGDIDYNNDYLVSCANSKPTTNITISNAETLARNKGANWHINDMGAESINQMLFMVEYATMNGQNAIGAGISKTSNMMNTGLTTTLGNDSGEAPLTSNVGYRAMSYRGYENWWGNAWNFIGGIGIKGDSNSNLGIPYIATNFNYDPENLTNYANVGFNISKVSSWVSAMGYGNETYDWIYLPAECNGANSAIPVGDNFWTMTNFTVNSIIGCGGTYSFDTYDGPFYYGCDRAYNYSSNSYNARVMYIPTKNSTYTANYNDWSAKMGG